MELEPIGTYWAPVDETGRMVGHRIFRSKKQALERRVPHATERAGRSIVAAIQVHLVPVSVPVPRMT